MKKYKDFLKWAITYNNNELFIPSKIELIKFIHSLKRYDKFIITYSRRVYMPESFLNGLLYPNARINSDKINARQYEITKVSDR